MDVINVFASNESDTNKDDLVFDGDIFMTEEFEESGEEFSDSLEDLDALGKKAKRPAWLKVVGIIGIIGVVFHIALITLLVTKGNAMGDIFGKYPILALTILISCIFTYLYLVRSRTYGMRFASEYAKAELDKIDSQIEQMYAKLGVPENAENIDVLTYSYKITKNGEKKTTPFDFCNMDMKVYTDGNMLHIADISSRYSFPLDEIYGIRTIDKKASLVSWNKDEGVNEGKYKQFKIREDNIGTVYFKTYYALQIRHEGKYYEIFFPGYDIDIIERLTGHKARPAE